MEKRVFHKPIFSIAITTLLLFIQTSIVAAPVVLPRPVPLKAETITHIRQAHANENNQWQLVVFGFTLCKDVCPTSMANLNMLIKTAEDEHINMGGTFVSIDPDRDSDTILASYTESFDANIAYLRFEDEELERFKDNFGVEVDFYTKNAGNQTHYQVDHSTTAFLIDPLGRIRVMFDATRDATSVAELFRENTALFKS